MVNEKPTVTRDFRAGYFTALLSTLLPLLVLAIGGVVWRAGGVRYVPAYLHAVYETALHSPKATDLEDRFVRELSAIGGNADDVPYEEHNTILVERDSSLVFRLRPGAEVSNFMIAPLNRWNLDPPVMAVRSSDVASLSPDLRTFIRENKINEYTYTVDGNGFRRTVPEVKSERKVLFIGDSGVFGVGLSDANTVPSAVQRRLGATFQVVNAGVGSYDPDQIMAYATELLDRGSYEAIVYVAHQNDMPGSVEGASEVADRAASLAARTPGRPVIVSFLPYMEYMVAKLNPVWDARDLKWQAAFYDAFRGRAQELEDILFVDMPGAMRAYVADQGTPFAIYGLFVDHAHLSPVAAEMYADSISRRLDEVLQINRSGQDTTPPS